MRNVLSNELWAGQRIVVIARWLLVLVGLLVVVWNSDPLPQLRVEIAVILLVAIANFVMHAQLLRHRRTMQAVAYAASLGDLLVITLLIATQGGFTSNIFVFYFPAILAISVAFPTTSAAALALVGLGLGLSVSGWGGSDPLAVALRGLSLGAMAVIGNAYWRLHRERIQPGSDAREAAADLFWGQEASIWARWAVALGGAALVLSQAADAGTLAFEIVPVVLLLIANFYLHGRYLLERPANATLTLLASAFDVAMLVLLYFSWSGQPGLGNPCYLLLYPVVFSVGLVFPPRIAWPFTSAALAIYSALMAPSVPLETGGLKILVVRLLTLAAVCGLASLYWRSVRREQRKVTHGADAADAASSLAWQPARAS